MLPLKTFGAGMGIGFLMAGWSFWHVVLFLFGGRILGLVVLAWNEARHEKRDPHSQQNWRVRQRIRREDKRRPSLVVPGMVKR
jgi:hypothetical protein